MKKYSIYIVRAVTILMFASSLSMVFHPGVRASVRSAFIKDFRSVLSTTQGTFNSAQNSFSFIKIRNQSGIIVEVYKQDSQSTQFVDKIELPTHKDAFFTFNGQATNLAIDDIDGDQEPELLVPSFDGQMIAHLNVYKFNSELKKFERQNPASF